MNSRQGKGKGSEESYERLILLRHIPDRLYLVQFYMFFTRFAQLLHTKQFVLLYEVILCLCYCILIDFDWATQDMRCILSSGTGKVAVKRLPNIAERRGTGMHPSTSESEAVPDHRPGFASCTWNVTVMARPVLTHQLQVCEWKSCLESKPPVRETCTWTETGCETTRVGKSHYSQAIT